MSYLLSSEPHQSQRLLTSLLPSSAPMALSGAPMASRALLRSGNDIYRDFKMPISMVSSTSTSTPRKVRKFTNRKNYLRQKLLKTLTKPYSKSLISELPHESPGIFPNESSPDENCIFPLEQYAAGGGEEGEELETQEVRVAEVLKRDEFIDSSVSGFSKDSVFKFGLWLLGAFVFQTICAVWVLGSADIDKNGNGSNEKDKNGILDVGLNGKDKSKLKLLGMGNKGFEGGGVFYLDVEDMEKKIKEIQLMAREARERERLGMGKNGFQSDDNDEAGEGVDFGKSGIEKEVNDQLVKLCRRLGNVQEKSSISLFTNNMKKDGGKRDQVEKDELDEEGNVGLMFKKKYKFRGSLSGNSDKPKGFKNSDHLSVPKEAMKDGRGGQVLMNGNIVGGGGLEKHDEKKQSVEASKSLRTAGKKLVEREKRKPAKKVDLVESDSNGRTHDRKEGRSGPTKSSKSNFVETPAISSKHITLNQKDDSKGTGTGLSAEIGHKKSESETDLWWLSLPYVLVIFMRRGLGDEGPQGPFTLKCSSDSDCKFSHTVAFEDRRDATNFCYILQSFFEDLEDFRAEIVPLSIKELKAAMESQIIKVMVVKKGQLKLYSGQPLPDVEMALRSILEQS